MGGFCCAQAEDCSVDNAPANILQKNQAATTVAPPEEQQGVESEKEIASIPAITEVPEEKNPAVTLPK